MANTALRAYLNDLKALLEREALEEVIGHCRHIIQHFPKNIEAYRTLGSALLERGRHAEAADVFQRVLGGVPDDFTAHIGLGSAFEESNVGAAIWHLERAFEQEPTNQALQDELSRLITVRDGAAPAAFNLTRGALARVYLKSQLYSQAIIELQGALQENKERVDLAVLLARTLWMSGHPVEASEIALQLLRTYPDNVEANRIMAALWLAMGRPSDAEPFIARLELLDPFLAWDTLHPDGTPVPRDAFQLPRLQWDARTAAAMDSSLPDWVTSIGDVFEAQEESAAMLSSSAAPVVSPWAEEDMTDLGGEYSPPPSGEVIPDWLSDVVEPAPEPPLMPTSSTVAEAFADYAPEWLNDEEEAAPAAPAPFGAGETSEAQTFEDALDWLNDSPGQPPSRGATNKLQPIDDFTGFDEIELDAFSAPLSAESAQATEQVETPPDFAIDPFSWLNTAPLTRPEQGAPPDSAPPAPAAPRARMPGETGPLTMLQPPTGPLGAPPPPPAPTPQPPPQAPPPVEPPPAALDEDVLAWLQTGSLAAPESEPPPALDFTAFEAELTTTDGAPSWLDADDFVGASLAAPTPDRTGERGDTGTTLETSAELLGDIEENPDLWAGMPDLSADEEPGADALQAPPTRTGEGEPELDLSFDSGWLADLGAPAQTAPAPGGDWLTEFGATPVEGPGDQAPDLDLAAWGITDSSAPGAPSETSADIAPASEIPGWLSKLRQTGQPATTGDEVESAAPVAPSAGEAGADFGEEISLESLDLGWLQGDGAPAAAAPQAVGDDLGLGPLGDLFLDDELAAAPLASEAAPGLAEPAESAEPPSAEQNDMMAWMQRVGILQEPPAAPETPQPVDDDLLAGIGEPAAKPETPPAPPERGVSEADVLAFLRDGSAPGAGDLYARMNEEETAQARAETPAAPPLGAVAPVSAPEPSIAAPPAIQEPVLEDDFLAAFEVGVSSAPTGSAAETDDWLSTLGRGAPADEPLGDDWLSQISRRASVAPLEEPPPVEPVAEEPATPPMPEEDTPLWQRPAVTASLAQASAAMDLFNAEEPLVSEEDIPAWMREASEDELLVAPTDSTPIASQEETGTRGLLNFIPQVTDAPSRSRMDTGILEPDRTPEWLAAFATDEDAAPEGESGAGDVQPDLLAALPSPAAPMPEPESAPGTDMNWLDNVFPSDSVISAESAFPVEEGVDVVDADADAAAAAAADQAAVADVPSWMQEYGVSAPDETPVAPEVEFDAGQPIAADMPSWMQELGLTPPDAANADRSAAGPSAPAPTPLEELDFSALDIGAPISGLAGAGDGDRFDFLAGFDAPPGEQGGQVAKAADMADTTNEAGAAAGGEAGQPRTPEPPAESKPGARFSFSKEPAWKRKRSGSDGAP